MSRSRPPSSSSGALPAAGLDASVSSSLSSVVARSSVLMRLGPPGCGLVSEPRSDVCGDGADAADDDVCRSSRMGAYSGSACDERARGPEAWAAAANNVSGRAT
eukprot:5733332-Prymnesium_polylepis.1